MLGCALSKGSAHKVRSGQHTHGAVVNAHPEAEAEVCTSSPQNVSVEGLTWRTLPVLKGLYGTV